MLKTLEMTRSKKKVKVLSTRRNETHIQVRNRMTRHNANTCWYNHCASCGATRARKMMKKKLQRRRAQDDDAAVSAKKLGTKDPHAGAKEQQEVEQMIP
mmetsp:Transcript_24502/g.61649  ORF Transcript_24502/g.61649 Transcript_24502/m.61649 type:complete len:99 (+) Transcript_24502:3331-3627(+)